MGVALFGVYMTRVCRDNHILENLPLAVHHSQLSNDSSRGNTFRQRPIALDYLEAGCGCISERDVEPDTFVLAYRNRGRASAVGRVDSVVHPCRTGHGS